MVRISDVRMSGTGYGTAVPHAAREAARGGPLSGLDFLESCRGKAVARGSY